MNRLDNPFMAIVVGMFISLLCALVSVALFQQNPFLVFLEMHIIIIIILIVISMFKDDLPW